MEHNNKHLLPGFHPSAFQTTFPGIPNAGTNALMSTLQQLSSLSGTSILPSTALGAADLAQWAANAAAAQPTSQGWMDPAKVAAMLPMYGVFTGVKGLDLPSDLLGQQGLPNVATTATASTAASIFPTQNFAGIHARNSPQAAKMRRDSPMVGPLSSTSSSHPSTSTPYEIDVGSISQPSSHCDLANGSPMIRSSVFETAPSTSSTELVNNNFPLSLLEATIPSTSAPVSSFSDTWNFMNSFATATTAAADNTAIDPGGDVQPPISQPSNLSFPISSVSNSVPQLATDDIADDAEFDIFGMVEQEKNAKAASPSHFMFDAAANNPSLSPVQFTPPDSPLGMSMQEPASPPPPPRPAMPPCSDQPSTSNGILTSPPATATPAPAVKSTPPRVAHATPSPKTVTPSSELNFESEAPVPAFKKPASRFNKIPVYKQKANNLIICEEKVATKDDSADAYSFDDEEEKQLTVTPVVDPRDKLDAEVREKLARMGQQGDARFKNIYVPGVGFAVPPEQQQDLWKHVVPKKRPTGENRSAIPAPNLLPSSMHAEAQAAARMEPEIVSLAESIRRRKKDRLCCAFIKTEQTFSNDCAKEDGADRRAAEFAKENDDRPRLPKLIIKLPRFSTSIDDDRERHAKKKKRRKDDDDDDDDSDWEGSDRAKRKRLRSLRHERRRSSGYEVRLVERADDEPMQTIEEEKPDPTMLSKKKRLMMQWEGDNQRSNGEALSNASARHQRHAKRSNEFNTEAIKYRLSKFGSAEGHLPKGTFVVCKADLFRDDCALWKVDNQNLLQKYPPKVDPATKNISYKNSSTYSGWCEQVASGYYRISIRHIKQSRSEAIIEPEIPLADLFPAMTSECTDTNTFIKVEDEVCNDADDQLPKDPIRLSVYTYTMAMITHALTLDYLQSIKEKNDWNFLRAVTEIEKSNSDCIAKLRSRVKLSERVEEVLQMYTQITSCDSELSDVHCQACGVKTVSSAVQLFSLDSYDRETLLHVEKEYEEVPLPATDIVVCSECLTIVKDYHSCYHMKYHLLKKCEDKLELLGTQHPELPPEKIIEMLKKNRGWANKVIAGYTDLWRHINATNCLTSF